MIPPRACTNCGLVATVLIESSVTVELPRFERQTEIEQATRTVWLCGGLTGCARELMRATRKDKH